MRDGPSRAVFLLGQNNALESLSIFKLFPDCKPNVKLLFQGDKTFQESFDEKKPFGARTNREVAIIS